MTTTKDTHVKRLDALYQTGRLSETLSSSFHWLEGRGAPTGELAVQLVETIHRIRCLLDTRVRDDGKRGSELHTFDLLVQQAIQSRSDGATWPVGERGPMPALSFPRPEERD